MNWIITMIITNKLFTVANPFPRRGRMHGREPSVGAVR